MADFFLNVLLPAGMAITALALLHCAITRRGVAWFLITLFLGPLGGLVYIAGHMGWLPFNPPAPLQAEETAARRCPRCQQPAGLLHEFQDGRKTIQVCQMCKAELELKRSDFQLPG